MADREIIEYGNIESPSPRMLVEGVTSLIKNGQGWQPFGSPVTFGNVLVQTVVKYREPDAG